MAMSGAKLPRLLLGNIKTLPWEEGVRENGTGPQNLRKFSL